MNGIALESYYLFDLAWYRDGLRHLFEAEPEPRYTLLYLQTVQASAAQQGPLLIAPRSIEAREMLQQRVAAGVVVELQSTATMDLIVMHLRSLTYAQRDNNASVILRYADPRLYAGICPSLSDADRRRLLGPLVSMTGEALGQPWTLTQPADAAGNWMTPPETDFRLTRRHERCLKAWRGQALLQPIAERHGLSLMRLTEWYRQMPAMGFPSEHARVQGCERLAQYRLDLSIGPGIAQEVRSLSGTWREKLARLEVRFAEQERLGSGRHGGRQVERNAIHG